MKLWFVVRLVCFLTLRKQKSDGTTSLCWFPTRKSIVLLVFNSDFFRDRDLAVLSKDPNVSVLLLNTKIQRQLIKTFYGPVFDAVDYYHIKEGTLFDTVRKQVRQAIRKILRPLFLIHGVDAVLTPNVRYVVDLDWAYISEDLNVPSVVLYREGLVMYPRAYNGSVNRHKIFGKFQGTKIIVHNAAMKRMFLESEFAQAHQVKVCGALRMDLLLENIEKSQRSTPRTQILWLYFCPGRYQYETRDELGIRPPGVPTQLYDQFLESVLEYILRCPETTLLIKPKIILQKTEILPTREAIYLNLIRHKLKEQKYRGIAGSRVIIDDKVNIHEAISQSRVICGLQTTAMLEAAVFEKEIIIPYFEEFQNLSWSERLAYKSYPSLFTFVDNPDDLHEKISRALDPQHIISKEVIEGRRKLFEDWISPLTESSEGCYLREISDAIDERKRKSIN